MILCLVQAKEIRSPKRRRLLTVIHGSVILGVLRSEKGFRAATFGGFFLLRVQSPDSFMIFVSLNAR
ncbi:MAG TPA: hypothetical protein VIF40_19710, partial [Methylosinus sp.]|uniref:hypothetical protein n=1 Tax=Methylosinus sp. TaxID=427 RepID=UPI002F957044